MTLTPREIAQLKKIIVIAQDLIEKAGGAKKSGRANGGEGAVRIRRAGKDLAAFRKMLKAERKAGVPVSKIAKKHGISASYIYQLG
ncbi:hypothetical protein [Methylocystis sp. ATCC 49242]|uniref:hypothetical protein n=1 Tax=Methylocystis sp. ATCC 49242 TaxID=622637 RepID=UPI0001F88800|nr:hypothetical protein [Methylocystis sp. ATCC 49242]